MSRPGAIGCKSSIQFSLPRGIGREAIVEAMEGSGFAAVFGPESVGGFGPVTLISEELELEIQNETGLATTNPWGLSIDLSCEKSACEFAGENWFSLVTLDLSPLLNPEADHLQGAELEGIAERIVKLGLFESLLEVEHVHLSSRAQSDGASPLFGSRDDCFRALVKYGQALDRLLAASGWIASNRKGRSFDVAVSFQNDTVPPPPLEHAFVARELWRRSFPLTIFMTEVGSAPTIDQLIAHGSICRGMGHKLALNQGTQTDSELRQMVQAVNCPIHLNLLGFGVPELLDVVLERQPDLLPWLRAEYGGWLSAYANPVNYLDPLAKVDLLVPERWHDPRYRPNLHALTASLFLQAGMEGDSNCGVEFNRFIETHSDEMASRMIARLQELLSHLRNPVT